MRHRVFLALLTCLVAGCGGSSTPASPPLLAPTSTSMPAATTTAPPVMASAPSLSTTTMASDRLVRTGADRLVDGGFAELAGRRVGLIGNQTSRVGGRHLVDALAEEPDVDLVAIFAPEHGIRGTADAGATVNDEIDPATGVSIFSLYGTTRRPTASSLAAVDVLVYDLQDVGTRFYTYISTMGLSMQAAAEAGIPFIVLDRPNPLGGDTVTGFTRDAQHESFVGQYPVPSVYGLTAGELARAIQGEGWLSGLENLELKVIEMQGWRRSDRWDDTGLEWIAPSPGLPSSDAALAYPGTVLFETSTLSYGKGTSHPFSTVGAPWVDGPAAAAALNEVGLPGVRFEAIEFTPDPAVAPNPRFPGVTLPGIRYVIDDPAIFEPLPTGVHVMVAMRTQAEMAGVAPIIDRREMFGLLAGTDQLLQMLDSGASAEEIIAAWEYDGGAFAVVREQYLLYNEG